MKTPANDQEQKPRAEARGAHAAWRVVKELESRLNPAGAGAKKKAAPGNTRDGEKRAVRALREVRATQRPSLEISRQASPGRRFGAWGLGRAPATAQGLLDRTPRGREGRAGIERVPAARFGAGVPRRPVTDQAAGYLLSSRCVWDAWAGLEPAANRLWVCCSTAELPREKMEAIRRPLFRRFPQSQLRHLCYPQCGGRHPGTDRFLRDDKRPQCAASCSMPEHRPHRRAS